MSDKVELIVPCPQCKTPVHWSEQSSYRPFCSKRCKLIDLGAWVNEEHRIPSDPQYSQRSESSMDDFDDSTIDD